MSESPSPPSEPAAAPPAGRVSLPDSIPYVTYTIVGVTAAVYLAQLASVFLFGYANGPSQLDWLAAFGAQYNPAIRAGQIWRLLTPVLLHGSIPHIGFNMYALVIFGSGLERHFGRGRFLLLYLLGAFSGNVFSFLFTKDYSIGASTAIFGLIGAQGVFLYQNRRLFGRQVKSALGNIIFVAAINLLFGAFLLPGIDNWGHVGGLLGGSIFTWFAGPRWELEGEYPEMRLADKREPLAVLTGAAAVILMFGSLAAFGMVRPLIP